MRLLCLAELKYSYHLLSQNVTMSPSLYILSFCRSQDSTRSWILISFPCGTQLGCSLLCLSLRVLGILMDAVHPCSHQDAGFLSGWCTRVVRCRSVIRMMILHLGALCVPNSDNTLGFWHATGLPPSALHPTLGCTLCAKFGYYSRLLACHCIAIVCTSSYTLRCTLCAKFGYHSRLLACYWIPTICTSLSTLLIPYYYFLQFFRW